MSAKVNNSILRRVSETGRFFSVALVSVMVLNLLLMYTFQLRNASFATEINQVAALMPVVDEKVPDEIWEVITGRHAFSECQAYAMLDEVEATLDQFHTSDAEATELLVVRRSLGTMQSYVQQIEANINGHVSVIDSQKQLDNLRSVGSLTRDMLGDYLIKRVEMAGEESRKNWVFFIACCVGEALLWAGIYFVSSFANRKLTKYIGNQIRQLSDFASQLADGDMDARAPEMQTPELQPLTESMNAMAEQLNALIVQNKIEQENLKKSELRTLQAQISPHFLYNTLDAIIWQAEAKNTNEVIHITRALSDFFRISLNSGEEWITVAQEKQHLEGYLSIQKVRYRDILEYSVDIDPEIEDKIMLKLLLQPLVENALYHGVKKKRGIGTIRVVGRREGDNLCFSVEDNGGGMTPERLSEIRAALKNDQIQVNSEAEGGSGFGLKNVDLRIRLYYNQSEGLSIESASSGTRVSFRLPAEMKGKNNHV